MFICICNFTKAEKESGYKNKLTLFEQDFMTKFEGQLTPAGLGFFQSDYDSSVKRVFHDVLEMREPRFEYNFVPHYIRPWLTEVPEDRR